MTPAEADALLWDVARALQAGRPPPLVVALDDGARWREAWESAEDYAALMVVLESVDPQRAERAFVATVTTPGRLTPVERLRLHCPSPPTLPEMLAAMGVAS